jgi:hypothetical protein
LHPVIVGVRHVHFPVNAHCDGTTTGVFSDPDNELVSVNSGSTTSELSIGVAVPEIGEISFPASAQAAYSIPTRIAATTTRLDIIVEWSGLLRPANPVFSSDLWIRPHLLFICTGVFVNTTTLQFDEICGIEQILY